LHNFSFHIHTHLLGWKIYELIYEVEEPILNEQEKIYREQLTSAIEDLINFENVVERDNEALLVYIDQRMKLLAMEFGMDIPYESYKKLLLPLQRFFRREWDRANIKRLFCEKMHNVMGG